MCSVNYVALTQLCRINWFLFLVVDTIGVMLMFILNLSETELDPYPKAVSTSKSCQCTVDSLMLNRFVSTGTYICVLCRLPECPDGAKDLGNLLLDLHESFIWNERNWLKTHLFSSLQDNVSLSCMFPEPLGVNYYYIFLADGNL